jgi:fumarate hydratase, class II
VGTGLNTHPEFAAGCVRVWWPTPGCPIAPPADPFEAQGARDGLVETSGALKVLAVSLTKIANDLRWMASSGPRAGLAEIRLPELQKGSSIMPGKVNPVIPEVVAQVAAQVIGNDTTITVAGMQGNFELNVMVPVMARNLLESIQPAHLGLSTCSRSGAWRGSRPTERMCERHAEQTLATATALNPHIGYDRRHRDRAQAAATGRPLREVAREHGVADEVLDEALDLRRIARGG